MIIGFPSPLQEFEVCVPVQKETPTRYAHLVGMPAALVFQSPIDLQPNDHIYIDMRTGQVHIVERGGITIWRSGCWN